MTAIAHLFALVAMWLQAALPAPPAATPTPTPPPARVAVVATPTPRPPAPTPAPAVPAAYTALVADLTGMRAQHLSNAANAASWAPRYGLPVDAYAAQERQYAGMYTWRIAVAGDLLACRLGELPALVANLEEGKALHRQWAEAWESGNPQAANLGSEGPLQRVWMARYDTRISQARTLAARC